MHWSTWTPSGPQSTGIQSFVHMDVFPGCLRYEGNLSDQSRQALSPNGMGFWEDQIHTKYGWLSILEDADKFGKKTKAAVGPGWAGQCYFQQRDQRRPDGGLNFLVKNSIRKDGAFFKY